MLLRLIIPSLGVHLKGIISNELHMEIFVGAWLKIE